MDNVYTCSFIFDKSGRILLVKKDHGPDVVIGKWNGVGGHLNPNEHILEGALREVKEETTMDLEFLRLFCTLRFPPVNTFDAKGGSEWKPGAVVYFMTAVVGSLPDRRIPKINDAGEQQHVFEPQAIPTLGVVYNLTWLIPMARDPENIYVDARPFDYAVKK